MGMSFSLFSLVLGMHCTNSQIHIYALCCLFIQFVEKLIDSMKCKLRTEMTHCGMSLRMKWKLQQVQLIIIMVNVMLMMYLMWYMKDIIVVRSLGLEERKKSKKRLRNEILNGLIRESDMSCKNEFHLNRQTLNVLCEMLRDIGGLNGT